MDTIKLSANAGWTVYDANHNLIYDSHNGAAELTHLPSSGTLVIATGGQPGVLAFSSVEQIVFA